MTKANIFIGNFEDSIWNTNTTSIEVESILKEYYRSANLFCYHTTDANTLKLRKIQWSIPRGCQLEVDNKLVMRSARDTVIVKEFSKIESHRGQGENNWLDNDCKERGKSPENESFHDF